MLSNENLHNIIQSENDVYDNIQVNVYRYDKNEGVWRCNGSFENSYEDILSTDINETENSPYEFQQKVFPEYNTFTENYMYQTDIDYSGVDASEQMRFNQFGDEFQEYKYNVMANSSY